MNDPYTNISTYIYISVNNPVFEYSTFIIKSHDHTYVHTCVCTYGQIAREYVHSRPQLFLFTYLIALSKLNKKPTTYRLTDRQTYWRTDGRLQSSKF